MKAQRIAFISTADIVTLGARARTGYTGGVHGFLAQHWSNRESRENDRASASRFSGLRTTVVQNGRSIIDYKEIPGITGGAPDSHEELPRPDYRQGSEKGQASYRRTLITPTEK